MTTADSAVLSLFDQAMLFCARSIFAAGFGILALNRGVQRLVRLLAEARA